MHSVLTELPTDRSVQFSSPISYYPVPDCIDQRRDRRFSALPEGLDGLTGPA
jgi:hypothetical protein